MTTQRKPRRKGKAEMVMEAREARPLEDDAETFEQYCGFYSVPTIVRIDVYPRDLQSYAAQADYLIGLGNQMKMALARLQSIHGMKPKEQALLASEGMNHMRFTHRQLKTVAGRNGR